MLVERVYIRFQSRWHNPPRVGLYGPLSKRHLGGCAIYSETTVIFCGSANIMLRVRSGIRTVKHDRLCDRLNSVATVASETSTDSVSFRQTMERKVDLA